MVTSKYSKVMLNFKEVLPINKQLVISDLAGVLRSKEGAKIFPTKTKLEDACQLRRQVFKQSE